MLIGMARLHPKHRMVLRPHNERNSASSWQVMKDGMNREACGDWKRFAWGMAVSAKETRVTRESGGSCLKSIGTPHSIHCLVINFIIHGHQGACNSHFRTRPFPSKGMVKKNQQKMLRDFKEKQCGEFPTESWDDILPGADWQDSRFIQTPFGPGKHPNTSSLSTFSVVPAGKLSGYHDV